MTNDQITHLCFGLMKADTESDVIELLSNASLWNDTAVWRYYGD
jgi:hypothetical protein